MITIITTTNDSLLSAYNLPTTFAALMRVIKYNYMETTNELTVNADTLLCDIQVAFTESYPYLHIDFLDINMNAKLLRSAFIDTSTSLKQLQFSGDIATINISSYRTVAEVTHELQDVVGVIVQVSRRSGKVLNKISVTEGWTLETQNAEGKFISSMI